MPIRHHRFLRVCGTVIAGLAILTGCQTYQSKVEVARRTLPDDPIKAASLLEPEAKKENDDQLIYLLDWAVALQMAGEFKQSAEAFSKAEKMADIQDYTSLSREAGAILLNEGMVQYKGDDFEKVLINAVNSINFLMMGDLDSALVEVRRLNDKLYKFKYEAKRNYAQNPFAFYMSAVIWEADRKWDDAYIAYKNAYDVAPNYPPLREDLIRAAVRAQRDEDLEMWKKKFPEVKIRKEWKDPTYGELVFVLQQGWGPRKRPRPENFRFPVLVPFPTNTQRVLVRATPVEKGAPIIRGEIPTDNNGFEGKSASVFSVQDVAIKTLDDAYAALVARRIGGVVAKAIVADQLRQKNEALGQLAFIAMNLADQADLRQWSTLPQSFQFSRLFLKAGTYKVRANGIDFYGSPSGEEMPEKEVVIKPGKKAFIAWRSFR